MLTFDGWKDDPREVAEISAIRTYFAALTDAWPYWLHFSEKVGDTLPLVLRLLCRGHVEQVAAVVTSLPVQQRRRIRLDPATETAGLRAEPIIGLLLLGRCLTAARALLDRIGAGHPFGAIEPMPMPVQVNALGPHR